MSKKTCFQHFFKHCVLVRNMWLFPSIIVHPPLRTPPARHNLGWSQAHEKRVAPQYNVSAERKNAKQATMTVLTMGCRVEPQDYSSGNARNHQDQQNPPPETARRPPKQNHPSNPKTPQCRLTVSFKKYRCSKLERKINVIKTGEAKHDKGNVLKQRQTEYTQCNLHDTILD